MIPLWIAYGSGILFHLWAGLIVWYVIETPRPVGSSWHGVPFIGLIFFYSWLVWG